MSGGFFCTCKPPDRSKWRVLTRNGNYSAFNGYRYAYSDYSSICCLVCDMHWRTKAAYVDSLPDRDSKGSAA